MNSKRSEKRLQRSKTARKVAVAPPKSETLEAMTSEQLQELGAKVLHEAEQRIKDVLGPDGLRKVFRLDSNLDPVVLATIAAALVPNEYDRLKDRKAIVRAAMLLSEAQDLVKEGPTILDLPTGAEAPLLRFWNPPEKQQLDKIARVADSKKRFRGRAKFITRQEKAGLAQTDLFEMLGQWAKEQGKTDNEAYAYKEDYKKLLSSSDIDFLPIIGLRIVFAEWKAQSRSAKAAAAGKKSQENRQSQKS